jgi:hypothetical protein
MVDIPFSRICNTSFLNLRCPLWFWTEIFQAGGGRGLLG